MRVQGIPIFAGSIPGSDADQQRACQSDVRQLMYFEKLVMQPSILRNNCIDVLSGVCACVYVSPCVFVYVYVCPCVCA